MSRITKIIKTTSESKALKSLRLMKGLSVRKTADLKGRFIRTFFDNRT